MKTLILTLTFIFQLFCTAALAQKAVPHLGTPQALLEQAQKNRTELLNVLLKMKDHVRELRDQQTFDQFFNTLDQLESLSKKHRLESIYPNAVKEVGIAMIQHGNRWLKIGNDQPKKILSYQKWADLAVAQQFQVQVFDEMSRITQKKNLERAFTNLMVLEKWVRQTFPEDLYLAPAYQRAVGELSFKALIQIDITQNQEWQLWITGLTTQAVAQDYISFLNEKILISQLSAKDASQWQILIMALGNQLTSINQLSPSIKANYGILVVDVYSTLLNQEKTIDPALFKETIKSLDLATIRSLVFRWINPSTKYTNSYMSSQIQLSEILYAEIRKRQIHQSSLDLQKYISNELSPHLLVRSGFEGTYSVFDQNKKAWNFTIIKETDSRIIAALCTPQADPCYTFFDIKYYPEQKSFIAFENSPSDQISRNISLKIQFVLSDNIVLEMPFLQREVGRLTGQKTQQHPNFLAQKRVMDSKIEGRFFGRINFAKGPMDFILTITSNGEYSVARLEADNGTSETYFHKGTSGLDGAIYLTTGRTENGSWLHLRLKNRDFLTLEGIAIVGGFGQVATVTFEKQGPSQPLSKKK